MRYSGTLLFSVGLLCLGFMASASVVYGAAPAGGPTLTKSIGEAIALAGATPEEQGELARIYSAFSGQELWASNKRKKTLLRLLTSLESDAIDVNRLGRLEAPAISRVQREVSASLVLLRVCHAMADGQVSRDQVPGWAIERNASLMVDAVIDAIRTDDIMSVLSSLRPSAEEYAQLSKAYLRYRKLEMEPWPALSTFDKVASPNDAAWPEVTNRLHLLGDLQGEATDSKAVDGAVRRFQRRHGLDEDGRIGSETLSQLNISPSRRADQIAVNLEYWRLLPHQWPARYVTVNAADASLAVMESGQNRFRARVIVGDPEHQTPVMNASIKAVTFNPDWTIPRSIAVNEILPRLRRDAHYLLDRDIVVVDRTDDPSGTTIDWRNFSRNNFPFQLRQLPGPNNALGLVKFEMPNRNDVFLHDTPERTLFSRSSRALSHGCVRVECAQELAMQLIDNPALWLERDTLAALKEGRTLTVPLRAPLPVFLLYFTAFAGPDGDVQFRKDMYGRDKAVLAALQAAKTGARQSIQWSGGP